MDKPGEECGIYYRFFILLILFFGISLKISAQKYQFSQFSIQNGLVQSQVLKIFQDNNHYIWITTYGGLSRFNGKEFISFTKSDGLNNNMITAITQDKKNRILLGTEAGLSTLSGTRFHNFTIPGNTQGAWVRDIAEDKQGTIWLIRKSKLFAIRERKISPVVITSADEYITCFTLSKTGLLYASVQGKGIFYFSKNKWLKWISYNEEIKDIMISKMFFDKKDINKIYILSPRQIFIAKSANLKPYRHLLLDIGKQYLFAFAQDDKGALWVGTNNGAYYLRDQNPIHFTAANGFTNFSVNDVFLDKEDNIWLATDGAGVFKYNGDSYVSFNRLNGQEQIIMGMAPDKKGSIFMGTFNNGLLKYDGKTVTNLLLPSQNPFSKHINTLYREADGNLLIGSLDGLWRYNGQSFKSLGVEKDSPSFIRSITVDQRGTIWITTPKGCFYYKEKRPKLIADLFHSANSIIEYNTDSMLLGTDNGIALIQKKVLDKKFKLTALKNTIVLCLVKYKNIVLAGTFGDGIYVINLQKNAIKHYNEKNGLYSNDIYSLTTDKAGTIWAGTGRGVNKFKINTASLFLSVIKDATPKALIECNQNSILYFQNKIWVGTTTGVYVYNTDISHSANKRPFINIQSVKIINQYTTKNKSETQIYTNNIPKLLKLNHKQNRIIISFRSIYFTNPDDVSYQYRLKGLDTNFSSVVNTNLIEYPSLLPGKYTFEVQAITSNSKSNIDSVTFEITPPYYQTWWFRAAAFLLSAAGLLSLQRYINSKEKRRMRLIEKIKNEEQLKIRSQTAEDFHDDIGNKLTRIAVLADILDKKINNECTEQKELISQIKENAATVYNGTKDILWALDPQSDDLYEILTYITDFASDLFQNTEISFISDKIDPSLKKIPLPMEYSRNLGMIFKELFGNALKHADAQTITFTIMRVDESIDLTLTDDGIGYDTNQDNKGRGLKNIVIRAKRINARVEFKSIQNEGSRTTLQFKP